MHRATRLIQDHFRRHDDHLGVSSGEAHLVSYLANYRPVTVGTLVEVFGLKKSTLTGALDRLVERDLAQREVSPDDRHSFLVDLTIAGRREATGVRAMLEEFESALDDELSTADKQAFTRVMEAINRVTIPEPEDTP